MFKIVEPTKALVAFLLFLKLRFSAPQQRHLTNFMEALLACDGSKTIAKLNRLILNPTDPSAFTDFFTYSPWDNAQLRRLVMRAIVHWIVEGDGQQELLSEPLFILVDDSKSNKPKTSLHFEIVDWFFNSEEGRGYGYGAVFVTVHLRKGNRSSLVALRLYLRQSTVRRLNRERQKSNNGKHLLKKVSFKSKYTIVKEILKELALLLPEKARVYVLFDSWYASKKLIRFCRQRGWHVICRLKRNRLFRKNGRAEYRSLSRHARWIRTKNLTATTVGSSDSSTRYWVYSMRGHLQGIQDEVSIIISKRHSRDKRPEFFLVTDLNLTAREALQYYGKRWDIEVDHLYLKVHLGLGDFRLRSYEGISKYFDLVALTLMYLQWRKAREEPSRVKNFSDVIALHRREQQEACLKAFGQKVLATGSVEQAMAEWFRQAA